MEPDEARQRRTALIAQLDRERVLHDDAIRAALLHVPRHLFLPGESLERAYANDAIATKFADGVAISSASQPAIVALMLEQLALAPGMRVLEIGAGTGYNAALLRTLVGRHGQVTTVDIDADITDAARAHLAAAGITDVVAVTADGAGGYRPNTPYDRIILTVNAGDIAPDWVAQLRSGGILVLPLSVGATQLSIAFEKRDDGTLHGRSIQPCGFMPLRGAMGESLAGSRTLSPRPGLRLSMTNASALDAEAIARLLESSPIPYTIPGLREGWFAMLTFALSDRKEGRVAAFITSDDTRYGFGGYAYGVFERGARSGAIIRLSNMRGCTADLPTLGYGSSQTATWLEGVIARWEAQGSPRPAEYSVTAYPKDQSIAPPPDAAVVQLPHWRLVFTVRKS